MRVADVLAREFIRAGIRVAFGIPGGEVLTLIDALAAAGIDFVTTRHEMGAGIAAQGVWAASGVPGLFVVTVGPGVTNAVNAIANAALDRAPLIVVSGTVEQRRPHGYTHQVLDQCALLRPIVKASFIANAASIARIAEDALELACAHPRGPVHIELAMSLAEQAAEAEYKAKPRDAHAPHPMDAARLREAAEWLGRARRPLILAGLEAVDHAVASAVRDIARAHAIPLLTTYKAKGLLDERDPLCIGAIGLSPKADALAQPLLRSADAVLLAGYDPVEMRASYVDPFSPSARVIELSGAARAHAVHSAQREIAGDLARNLRVLERELCRHPRQPTWPEGQPARVQTQLRETFAPERAPGFSPLSVAHTLARALPDDAYLTLDTGAHRIVASQVLRAKWPGQIQQSNGLCTMGFALPCAIGLSLATQRRVIAVMGDGGFDMLVGELATLRDLALPVTCVVFDDRSLALIDLKQRASGFERRGVWLGATDHVAVARAFGGRGWRVHHSAELAYALTEALGATDTFSVISCALERGAYEGLI